MPASETDAREAAHETAAVPADTGAGVVEAGTSGAGNAEAGGAEAGSTGAGDTAAGDTGAGDTGEPAPPRIAAVRHLGQVPRAAGPGWRVLGQDGGQSIPLDAERTLFVFSDTLIQPDGGRPVLLPSCAALSGAGGGGGAGLLAALGNLRWLADEHGRPRTLLPPTPEERRHHLRFWPTHGFAHGGKVYLFYVGVEFVDPRSDWGFRNLGAGLAVIDPETGEAERVHRGGRWCLWPARGDDFHLGVQTLVDGDHAYAFFTRRRSLRARAGVARVPLDRVTDPDAYRFLATGGSTPAAPRWSPWLAEAASLGQASNHVSVAFNRHLGAYLVAWVDGYDKGLHLATAQHPWGPWSPPVRATTLPHQPGSELIYLGFEHPRFAADGGRTVALTYCEPHFVQSSVVEVRLA